MSLYIYPIVVSWTIWIVCMHKVWKNNSKRAFKYVSFTSYNPIFFFVSKVFNHKLVHGWADIDGKYIQKCKIITHHQQKRNFLFHLTNWVFLFSNKCIGRLVEAAAAAIASRKLHKDRLLVKVSILINFHAFFLLFCAWFALCFELEFSSTFIFFIYFLFHFASTQHTFCYLIMHWLVLPCCFFVVIICIIQVFIFLFFRMCKSKWPKCQQQQQKTTPNPTKRKMTLNLCVWWPIKKNIVCVCVLVFVYDAGYLMISSALQEI